MRGETSTALWEGTTHLFSPFITSLAGWLAGWLVGWLAGWLAGWLTDWLDEKPVPITLDKNAASVSEFAAEQAGREHHDSDLSSDHHQRLMKDGSLRQSR
ncbi:hypothetical protein Pmani_009430 [Petrolisthes manimaculis]|uniref:Uncharacterized protein n=1 Tax=Petrolisthes manimaculis TaxID=1843537 RepID=A0AAE1Q4T6_9EUCA|nr:hypothetical protein Pmani_009430 [Petrolisthes manimaculis]